MIPNWRRFQHYKKRNPIWIKVYTELMSDPAFLGLTFAQRGLLISLWLEYARSRRSIIGHTSGVYRALGRHVTTSQLKTLSDAGFIEISASKPASKRYQSASPELLRNSNSRDDAAAVETATTSRQQLDAAARRFVADWNGGSSDAFDEALDELEQLTGARLKASDRYQLWDQAQAQAQLH